MLCSHVCHFEAAETERTPVKDRQVLVGQHTLRLYGALSSDEASILVQARTEHCGLNACLFRKKLADSPTCECGRSGETVLHVLLRCNLYAEARKALREAAGDSWGDASYLLGG